MSEARPLFLQLAELHLKNHRQPEAIALLKKLLQAEPDNLRIQIRLADLYQAMGQSGEALETYISAAQRALARGEQAECEKLADKALHLSPKHLDALIVKARSYMTQGHVSKATEILERVPDLEKGGEPAELLMDLYLKNGKWDEATGLALRIFSTDEKNFSATQKVTEALLASGQGERAMSVLSRIRIPMIDAGEHEGVVHLLNELVSRLPGRLEPLEWLVDTFGRTSDSFRLPDALAQLGDALVAGGKLQRAKEVFEQLVDRAPENDGAKRKLNDVLRKLGVATTEPPPPPVIETPVAFEDLQAELPQAPAPKLRGVEEPPALVSSQDTPAPAPVEPQLDEETEKFIAQSLTDVDLFASYGLTQKAIGLLEAILRRAPTHTPTLEKLLDFVLGAGDDRRTAELAAQLEYLHGSRGDSRSGERFGELRRRFQRAAGMTDDEIQAAVNAAMPQPVETVPVEEGAADIIAELPEEAVQALGETAKAEGAPSSLAAADAPSAEAEELPEIEIVEETPEPAAAEAKAGSRTEEVDLSAEWARLLEETKDASLPATPPAKSPEPESEEDQPAGAAAEPQAETPLPKSEDTGLAEFHVPVEDVDQEAGSSPLPDRSAEPSPTEAGAPGEEVPHAGRERGLEEGQPALHEPHAPEPEFELDQEFELVLEPENIVPPHEMLSPVPPPSHEDPAPAPSAKAPANGSGFSTADFLSDLAKEIDELGLDKLVPATSEPAASVDSEPEHAAEVAKQPVGVSGEPGPLKEVFDEFRAELGEMGSEDEDLETHYNLGIAFREMGL